MRRNKTHEVIRDTIALFEHPGTWTQGSFNYMNSYCLIGGINHVQYRDPRSRLNPRTRLVVAALGFDSVDAAMRWNDIQTGKQSVLRRLRRAYEMLDPWRPLHEALDESRVAHAKRDLGKNVPSTIPEAWIDEQKIKEEVEVR